MIKADSPSYLVLIQEKTILEKKVEHLDNFVKSCRLGKQDDQGITKYELELLEEQLHYMRGYLRCLNCRIEQYNSNS